MNIEGKTNKQLQRMVVAHWGRMLKLSVKDIIAKKERPSIHKCAFCVKYYERDCVHCPIERQTSRNFCWATPYCKADDLYHEIQMGFHRKIKTFHKAVQKMIDFLEALEC